MKKTTLILRPVMHIQLVQAQHYNMKVLLY